MRQRILLFVGFLAGAALVQAGPPPGTVSAPAPPCSAAQYRQFDFWLGRWDVERPDGMPMGTNEVDSLYDGCVVQEHWRGAKGMNGTSLNVYSDEDHKWHQSWANNLGGPFQMSGGLVDGRMVMEREMVREGRKILQRWSWEKVNADKVIQRAESSADEGKTWTKIFEGVYVRRKP